MRFISYRGAHGEPGIATLVKGDYRGRTQDDPRHPGDLMSLLTRGGDALAQACDALSDAEIIDPACLVLDPVIPRPGKIMCVGLNFAAHTAEGDFDAPGTPELFGRFATSLIGSGAPLLRPRESEQLDFEGELAIVIGKRTRRVTKDAALRAVAGYCVFNDASIRDYQFRTPQWTAGKNFDGTGVLGPALVTADELPAGASGLKLQTRLNGETVQETTLDQMVFDVATIVSFVSEITTLDPGDVIPCGTPPGCGFARSPPLWMEPGDVCEVEIDQIGVLRNPVAQD